MELIGRSPCDMTMGRQARKPLDALPESLGSPPSSAIGGGGAANPLTCTLTWHDPNVAEVCIK